MSLKVWFCICVGACALGIGCIIGGAIVRDDPLQEFRRDNAEHIRMLRETRKQVDDRFKALDRELAERERLSKDPAYNARLKYDQWKVEQELLKERHRSR